MRALVLHRMAPAFLTVLLLSCATPGPARRPSDAPPGSASSEPVPPPSNKKGVIVPADVKLGADPSPAAGSPASAGPAGGSSLATPTSPN
jgi:hypothetical protein